jgi:alanyl-tRNA synthetase
VDGVVVARVDSGSRDQLRDMAVSLRDQPGVRAVVLGSSPDGKGVAIASAVRSDSGLHAYQLIEGALKLVQGGGSKSADVAVAGGKDAARLDEALDLVRTDLASIGS